MKNLILVVTAFCLFCLQTAFTSNLLNVDFEATRAFVLATGVGKFNNAQVKDLDYPINDASSLLWKVKSKSSAQVIYSKPLFDCEATKDNVVVELKRIAKIARENDVIMVYISSHGIFGAALLYGNEKISYYEINKILATSKCKNIYVILDVCYSGSAIIELAQYKRVVFICACMDSEESYELSTFKHGIFTYHILNALSGVADSDGDNIITVKELFNYIAVKTSVDATFCSREQHPVMTDLNDRPIFYLKKS
jgi:uncharacterized caspase-like protein